MIAKITRGSSVNGLANYLHGPGRANEHVYAQEVGGAVIGGTLAAEGARDGSLWAADMAAVMGQRVDVEKPVWHMSLRQPKGERVLTDAQWRDAAQEMGEQMGWAEHPWVVVRHAPDHVHVVVSRVGFGGELWHGRHDFREAQRARGVVEERLGLVQAPARSQATARRLSDGELSRGIRTGVAPERVQLADRVRVARDNATGLGREGFEELLGEAGVLFRANVASTGRVSGYSFGLPGHVNGEGEQVWFKASQLDKTFAWKQLEQSLGQPLAVPRHEVPEKKFFERRDRHAERVAAARRQAIAQDLARRRWEAKQKTPREATQRVNARRGEWQQVHERSPRTKHLELVELKARTKRMHEATHRTGPAPKLPPRRGLTRAERDEAREREQHIHLDPYRYDPPRQEHRHGIFR